MRRAALLGPFHFKVHHIHQEPHPYQQLLLPHRASRRKEDLDRPHAALLAAARLARERAGPPPARRRPSPDRQDVEVRVDAQAAAPKRRLAAGSLHREHFLPCWFFVPRVFQLHVEHAELVVAAVPRVDHPPNQPVVHVHNASDGRSNGLRAVPALVHRQKDVLRFVLPGVDLELQRPVGPAHLPVAEVAL
eukprot:CAMPEP_0179006462 /NCGR_PEP_ID=MMETSP0795-20121207/14564_1 /TAXON_ID=88552 /ORGANISM="Amoebophrya sp., Strain Ameob2" /LENGTH=190 /DNA_ID=CAMNT_0020701219 /DNA_START=88 /DNA_END=657 /DNA_ORIENTATION=+